MNDRRFTELLNLYLDHQIEPADAAELEAEVLGNPARRRTYDQYCRLQRACCFLGERERSIAPQSQGFARSLRDAERKLAAPRRPIPVWRTAYFGPFATAALAACVVVTVVINRHAALPPSAGDSVADARQPLVVQETVAPVQVAAALTPAISPPSAAGLSAFEAQPVLASAGLGVARTAREAEIAANDREALEWMQRVEALQLQRVVVDEQAFEARPTLQQDNRVFRSRHNLQGNAEFAAFQFQR